MRRPSISCSALGVGLLITIEHYSSSQIGYRLSRLSATVSPRLSKAKLTCAGYGGVMTQQPLRGWLRRPVRRTVRGLRGLLRFPRADMEEISHNLGVLYVGAGKD
jgi:hypothetical protein